MFLALKAQTSADRNDIWRIVYFLLEEGHADYTYTTRDGNSLQTIIRSIREHAVADRITMPPDFMAVVVWLRQHRIDTDPDKNVQPEL